MRKEGLKRITKRNSIYSLQAKKHQEKSNKGITLIALVVTIVVLLILAGISINLIFSEGGIIKKAQEAADAQKEAEESDKSAIESLGEQVNALLNGGTSGGGNSGNGGNNPPVQITKGEKVTTTDGSTHVTYTDSTGTAEIPVGFCVVKDVERDGVTDENTVARGLVISDVANDDLNNSQKGNQFVWIPVDNTNNQTAKFHLIEGYSNKSPQSYLSAESNPSREAGATAAAGSPLANNNTAGKTESIAMYQSVKDNGGFYIARFEAGVAGTTASTTTNDTNKQTQTGTVKPVSQKGVGVWNYIPWGGTSSDTASDGLPGNDNSDGAVKVARSMYTKSSTCGVTSTLCYGVQWDAALNFIDPAYEAGTATKTSFVVDSKDQGNYSGSIAATGSSLAYEQKHIYDLAGNVIEWTMEAYDTNFRVNRGGCYDSTGSFDPASGRSGSSPNFTFIGIGFRVALYL